MLGKKPLVLVHIFSHFYQLSVTILHLCWATLKFFDFASIILLSTEVVDYHVTSPFLPSSSPLSLSFGELGMEPGGSCMLGKSVPLSWVPRPHDLSY